MMGGGWLRCDTMSLLHIAPLVSQYHDTATQDFSHITSQQLEISLANTFSSSRSHQCQDFQNLAATMFLFLAFDDIVTSV